VRISGTVPWYFETLTEALEAAEDGETIQVQAGTFSEAIDMTEAKSVLIEGGYDCFFTSAGSTTEICGPLSIENGTLALERISIRQGVD
jgi:hypothetical protein